MGERIDVRGRRCPWRGHGHSTRLRCGHRAHGVVSEWYPLLISQQAEESVFLCSVSLSSELPELQRMVGILKLIVGWTPGDSICGWHLK